MKCCHRSTTLLAEVALVLALLAPPAAAAAAVPATPGAVVRDAIVQAVRGRMGDGADIHVLSLWTSAAATEPKAVLATLEPGARIGPATRFSLAVDPGAPADGSRWAYAVASLSMVVDHTRVTRAVRRGEPITAADVAPSRDEVRDVWLKRLPLPGEVVGAQATRDLHPGQVIQSTMVAPAPLVKAGDFVSVIVRAAGIEVRARARASESGTLGAVIRLVNPDSGRVLKGRVIGPGEVEVLR